MAAPSRGAVTATVTVTNNGDRDGDEVVQAYVSLPAQPGKQLMPISSLCAFEKLSIQKGAAATVTLTCDGYALVAVGADGTAALTSLWISRVSRRYAIPRPPCGVIYFGSHAHADPVLIGACNPTTPPPIHHPSFILTGCWLAIRCLTHPCMHARGLFSPPPLFFSPPPLFTGTRTTATGTATLHVGGFSPGAVAATTEMVSGNVALK